MDDKQIPQNANTNCPGINSSKAGCPNRQQCQKGEQLLDPIIIQITKKFEDISHVIFIMSGKGGVGKSTIATQLAIVMSQKYQVGLLDVDICGPSVPTMLGLGGREVHHSAQGWSPVYYDNLAVMSIGFLVNNPNDAIVWRGPRKNGLIKQFLQQVNWGKLDYLIVDTPPGTSDQHLSLVQYLQCRKSDGAIVVTTPQQVSLIDVRKQLNFCKKTNVPIIGVIENMSGFICPSCKCQSILFTKTSGGAQKMCKDFNCKLLAKIPFDPKIQGLIDQGKSIFHTQESYQQQSTVIQAYFNIAKFLDQQLKYK